MASTDIVDIELDHTDTISASAEQETAIEKIIAFFTDPKTIGKVLILTGQAGSGKSTVINFIKDRTPAGYKPTLTSTTARSALLIGGITVDRLFAFERDTWTFRSEDRLRKNMGGSSPNIIIDEASMIGNGMAKLLGRAIKSYKKRLLLVGDWAQAKPVKDSWPFNNPLIKDAEVIFLLQNHRQNDAERDYLNALNEVRLGVAGDKTHEVFSSCEVNGPPEDDTYIRMYATNRQADNYNFNKVMDLAKTQMTQVYHACSTVTDKRSQELQYNYPLSDKEASSLLMSAGVPNGSPFTPGCRVIICRNGYTKSGYSYVNGNTGVLIKFSYKSDVSELCDSSCDELSDPYKPINIIPYCAHIKLDDGTVVVVPRHSFESKSAYGTTDYEVIGIPIRLAYAMTIHKTQGMTLNKAWVDVTSIADMKDHHGLLYVALSRTRRLADLCLTGFDLDLIKCDPQSRHLITS